MKLSTFVVLAAVIGGSFLIAPTSAEARRNYPTDTIYHKNKTGDLLIMSLIAEGCFTSFEAAQLKMQADGMEQNRRANVKRNINANRMRECFGNATPNGNTAYESATSY